MINTDKPLIDSDDYLSESLSYRTIIMTAFTSTAVASENAAKSAVHSSRSVETERESFPSMKVSELNLAEKAMRRDDLFNEEIQNAVLFPFSSHNESSDSDASLPRRKEES
jgi:hypothetical protein